MTRSRLPLKTEGVTDNQRPSTFRLECQVLAEMIFAPESISKGLSMLDDEYFEDLRTRAILSTIRGMESRSEHIDATSLLTKVDSKFYGEYILGQPNIEPSFIGIAAHCRALKEQYQRRVAYDSGCKLITCATEGADIESIFQATKDLAEDLEKGKGRKVMTLADYAEEYVNSLAEDKSARIPTGLSHLDYYLNGGFSSGELIILAARPSVGKTTLALQFARSATEHRNVCFVSEEMSGRSLAQRIMMSTGYCTRADLSALNKDVGNWHRIDQALAASADKHFFVIESASLPEIETQAAQFHREGRCDILYIDYLQIIPSGLKVANRVQEIGFITSRLKALAMHLNIPVVILSQLSRESARENRPPELFDLRDSGSIEQDADVVLFVHRPDEMERSSLELYIRKQRMGEVPFFPIKVRGDENYTNFVEVD